MIALMTLLAQQSTPPGGPSAAAGFLPLAMIGALVVFMLMTARSQKRREKRERETMYAKLAKNDRVLTIGGVVATVHAIKDNEVILKVDESTNTKMTFLKTSIQRILSDEPAGERK